MINRLKKLNVGCGRDIKEGYINLDIMKNEGVDVIHDLNKYPYPFKDNEFDEINAHHSLEHLDSILKPLEELWRITIRQGRIKITVPIYPSVWAMCDPTHKQFFTYTSLDYFTPDNLKDHYSKAWFNIKEKKIIFTKHFKFIEKIVNYYESFQKFYFLFLSYRIPAYAIYFELEVLKDDE